MQPQRSICIACLSLAGGGAEKVAVNLANHYSRQGYPTEMLLLEAEGPYVSMIDPGVQIVDLGLPRKRNLQSLHYLRPVRRYLKKRRPGVVLSVLRSSNIITGLAATGLSGIRLVFREANTLDEVWRSALIKKKAYLWGMRIAYKRAARIIANSHDTLDDLIRAGITDADKAIVIPNPVLPDNYKALSREEPEGAFVENPSVKIILAIGRLHVQKNYPMLIRAFGRLYARNRMLRLVIIGEGGEKEGLQSLAESLGLQEVVAFESFRENIFSWLRRADVLALSSSWEGFGNVLVEAMAVGTPIVATDCRGGPAMILECGRYGTLVAPNDEEAFADALQKTLDKTDHDRAPLIARAQQFTVSAVAQEYLKVLLNE